MSEIFGSLMFYDIYQANFMIYYCRYDCAEDCKWSLKAPLIIFALVFLFLFKLEKFLGEIHYNCFLFLCI